MSEQYIYDPVKIILPQNLMNRESLDSSAFIKTENHSKN
jgi:hypothetical protein